MNFLDFFSKNTQIPNFMKIRSVKDKLLHAWAGGREGRQIAQDEANGRFSQFCQRA